MELDLRRFIRLNKQILIWAAFFLLLILLRHLFSLVFITFILSYIFFNFINWLEKITRIRRQPLIMLLYVVFVLTLAGLLYLIIPQLWREFRIFVQDIPEVFEKLQNSLNSLAWQEESLAPLIAKVKARFALESLLGIDPDFLISRSTKLLVRGVALVSYFIVGILFSFLILYDYPKFKSWAVSLKESALKDIYLETGESIVQFAVVVGQTFQAQMLIAFINATLTAIGLMILNIHPVVVLSVIVFFAGLIPIVGTFISSVPIILIAFNDGGPALAGKAMIIILFIHLLETYFLNPRIVSVVMKINPVLTLMILYIGHAFFGVWGALLGVPVAVYFYRFIFTKAIGQPVPENGLGLTHEDDI